MRRNKTEGFTLIEILMVVAIIALLVVLTIGVYLRQLAKGYDARRKTDMAQIKVALEEYEKDHNCYPTAFSCTGDGEDVLKPYIPDVPCDPRTKTDYVYHPSTDTGCPSWYWMFTSLENSSDSIIDDLGCRYGCGPSSTYSYYVSSPNAPKPETGETASSGPTVPPGATYYGCFDGSCSLIVGEICEPYYPVQDCQGFCKGDQGQSINECK